MIKARQFIKLLGLVGLAALLLSSGITPATAQPLAPGSLTWQQSTASQWAEDDERSNVEISTSAWTTASAGALDQFRRDSALVASLDADGDGDVDLALEARGRGYLLTNNGAGTFVLHPAGDFDATRHGGNACELLSPDLDADGDSDLIEGNCEWNQGQANAVYINDGSGRFARLTEGDFDDPAEDTRTLAAFDADGDGDIDVAVGNYLASNGLFLNDGSGHLWRTPSGDFGNHIDRTVALATGDFDGDGDSDLVEGNQELPSVIYFNDGSGLFSRVDAGDFTGEARYTDSLAVADYDGDGDVDLTEGIGYTRPPRS